MTPKICIVVPTYNAEKYLPYCIESVIRQTRMDWELVIIDDGSYDQSPEVAARYAEQDHRIRAYKFQNAGVAAARNRGAEMASPGAEYLLFLDNDDRLLPDALEVLLLEMERSGAVAAYGLARHVDALGTPLNLRIEEEFGFERNEATGGRLRTIEASQPTTFASLVCWDCIATPGQVLIRNEALTQAGLFDPATVPSDDWDLWLRLSLLGDIQFLRRYTIDKRDHGTNVSSDGKAMAPAEPIIRRKLAQSLLLTPDQRRIARDGHRLSCLIRLSWAKPILRSGKILIALKTIYRAIRSYTQFRRMRYSC